jgi:hypothetical protein
LAGLAARFFERANLPAILHLVEKSRDSPEGDRFFLQNIAISPKRTSFPEGDKNVDGGLGVCEM